MKNHFFNYIFGAKLIGIGLRNQHYTGVEIWPWNAQFRVIHNKAVQMMKTPFIIDIFRHYQIRIELDSKEFWEKFKP